MVPKEKALYYGSISCATLASVCHRAIPVTAAVFDVIQSKYSEKYGITCFFVSFFITINKYCNYKL